MIITLALFIIPYQSFTTLTTAFIIMRGVLGWNSFSPIFTTLRFFRDQLSGLILVMTILLVVLILHSAKPQHSLALVFISLILLLVVIMITTSIVIFYIWFELSLLPMVLLILGWGKQPERLIASLYILMYTITGSFPFLFIILYNKLLLLDPLSITSQPFLVSWCIILPFCVKLPIYYLHLWLPKAHVEAPVFGSIILAATLLKIGSYGVWRLSLLLNYSVSMLFLRVRLFRAGLCSWVTLSQVDIKAIIAYSRVVHIGIVMGTVLLSRYTSSLPALMMIISHGVCSSGLFYCATMSYERVSTRSMPIIQGLTIIRPMIILPWVLLLLINLRSPPTLSLISELFISGALIAFDGSIIIGVAIIIVLVLIYSLILYYSIYHGRINHSTQSSCETFKELLISNAHSMWFILWILGIWVYEA